MLVARDNDSLVEHLENVFHLSEPFGLFHLDRIFPSHWHWASLKGKRSSVGSVMRTLFLETSSQRTLGQGPEKRFPSKNMGSPLRGGLGPRANARLGS